MTCTLGLWNVTCTLDPANSESSSWNPESKAWNPEFKITLRGTTNRFLYISIFFQG